MAPPNPDESNQEQLTSLASGNLEQPQALVSAANPLIRTVNPGDRVNIPCSLANMGGSIQFAKDDQPIILDSGCAHCQLDISNDGQASLTINRVSIKDQGHWQCWRLDSQGKVKQKIPIIQLVITNSPELPILVVNDKELLGGNNLDATITVKENELVTFKCVIKGASSPVDYVHWMLDSTQNVTQSSQLLMDFVSQENNYLTQSVLKLNATKSMNLKSISCLSNHQLWLTPMTVTAFLNVLYEPSFTISREPGFGVNVYDGMTVILKCEIDSNPSSNPIWIKDADNKTSSTSADQLPRTERNSQQPTSGEPIILDTQPDGSVQLAPVQTSDSGWYRCKTENKYGNFSSFGYYLSVRSTNGASPPLASQSQQVVTPAPLQQTPRYPPSRPDQYSNPTAGQRVMAPNQPAMQAQAPIGRLPTPGYTNDQPRGPMFQAPSLPKPFGQQMGQDLMAKCPPSRAVDGIPQIDNPVMTVNAYLGRQLILPLRFCCHPGPSRVFWIHRHLAMIPGRMFGPYITREIFNSYNAQYCYESVFEIEAVKPEDIGTVYVFVSNEKGHAGAQIHIQLANPAMHDSSHHSNQIGK